MMNNVSGPKTVFSHAEPVLQVKDIIETVNYWHDVLGFTNKWIWGDPPNHGGVYRNGAFIQFSLNPKLAELSKGNYIWIRVRNIKPLYEFHQKKNASIVEPLENKPWGMASYTIEEINGYYVIFAAPITERESSSPEIIPSNIKIIARRPTITEYKDLISAVGWKVPTEKEQLELILNAIVHSVVAEDINSGNTIGCALLLGDNASFYYVKDVMIHPDWQKKRIGTELMQELTNWIDTNAPPNALIGLFTGENLEPFYKQFGFTQGFGMTRRM